MNPGNRIQIRDRDGWTKEFPLEKSIVQIGSDGRNDIVLDAARGAGVAPRHLQLIALPGGGPGYRVVNLGNSDVLVMGSEEKSLPPNSITQIAGGERFQLGEFTLAFCLDEGRVEELPAAPRRESILAGERLAERRAEPLYGSPGPATRQASASIGLRLSLPQPAVDAESPLEGIIVVQNLGQEPGVQFRLRLEGLDPDYYELGPGPILFPSVEKGVYLRIRHPRGPAILAGQREISIQATAPEAYPGESVTVSQVIQFLPFYHHEMRLVPVE